MASLSSLNGSEFKRLTPDQLKPITERRIHLILCVSDQERLEADVSLHKIYRVCKEALARKYQLDSFVVKGSSVAALFSKESSNDVDIQASIKFSHLKEVDEIRKQGFSIKWEILSAIRDLFLEVYPSKKEIIERLPAHSVQSDYKDLWFATGHLSDGASNIHQVFLDGVDFTCRANVYENKKEKRDFDYNCGALRADICDDGGGVLTSSLENLDRTLMQLSCKELYTEHPEEIDKKGFPRYLIKLVERGYVDPSSDLIEALITSYSRREKDVDLRGFIFEIEDFFNSKKVPLWALYTHLYFCMSEHPFFQEVKMQILPRLERELHLQNHPLKSTILIALSHEDAALFGWSLLLGSQLLKIKTHHQKPHLQLSYDFNRSCYFLIPLSVFSQRLKHQGIEILLDRPHETLKEPLCQETKTALHELLDKKAHDTLFFPVAFLLAQKFSLKAQVSITRKFCVWFALLSSDEQKWIPVDVFIYLLPFFSAQMPIGIDEKVVILKKIYEHLKDTRCDPYQKELSPEFVLALIKELIQFKKLEALKEIADLILYMQRAYFSSKEPVKPLKDIVYISSYLYKKETLNDNDLLSLARHCLIAGHEEEGIKIFSFLLEKRKLSAPTISQILSTLVSSSPSIFLKFLDENRPQLEQIEGFYEGFIRNYHEKIQQELNQGPFSKYLDHVLKLKDRFLLSALATLSRERALKGDKKALSVMIEASRCLKVSLSDIFELESIGDEIQLLVNYPPFALEMKTNPATQVQVIKCAIRNSFYKLAENEMKTLISSYPDKAFNLLEFFEKETLSFFEFRYLASWLLELNTRLEGQQEQIIKSSFAKNFFSLYQMQSKRCHEMTPLEKETLIDVHRVFLFLMSKETFEPLWSMIDFFDGAELEKLIDHTSLAQLMTRDDLFCFFEVYIKKLEGTKKFAAIFGRALREVISLEGIEKSHIPIGSFLTYLQKGEFGFWKIEGKLSLSESFLDLFKALFETYSKLEKEKKGDYTERVLVALRGVQLFGSQKEDLLLQITERFLTQEQKKDESAYKNLAKLQILYAAHISKCLHDKNLREVGRCLLSYKQLFPDNASRLVFLENSLESMDALCKEFCKSLGECNFSSFEEMPFDQRSTLKLYQTLLIDLFLTCYDKDGPLTQKGKFFFTRIKDQFQFLSQKKNFGVLDSLKDVFELYESVGKKEQIELLSKLLKLSTEVLKRKEVIPKGFEEDLINSVLINLNLIAEFSEDVKTGVLGEEIKAYLEAIRHPLYNRENHRSFRDEIVLGFRFLESLLTPALFDQYTQNWVVELVRKSEKVTFHELKGFAHIHLRVQPLFKKAMKEYPSFCIATKGPIDYAALFSDRAVLESFLKLFHLAFSRFSDNIPDHQRFDEPGDLTIFTLFGIVCSALRAAIFKIKQEKEKNALLEILFSFSFPLIEGRAHSLSKQAISMSWSCLLSVERSGALKFRSAEKGAMKRNVEVFTSIYKKVDGLTDQEKKDSGIVVERMNELFISNRDLFKKYLQPDAFEALAAQVEKQGGAAAAPFTLPTLSDSGDGMVQFSLDEF